MESSIVDILRRRRENGRESDSRRLGLVIQGGGMRGVYSLSVISLLERLGFNTLFDEVFGSSSGAINSAYFLVGKASDSIKVYTDYLSTSEFINYFRFNKILNIDFLVDDILRDRHPIDPTELMSTGSRLNIVLTNADSGCGHTVTNRNHNVDIFEVFRATAAVPLLYDKSVEIAGDHYVDGGVADAIPLFRAVNAGCTDILVVTTRMPGYRRDKRPLFVRQIISILLSRHSERLRSKITSKDERFNKTMQVLENKRKYKNAALYVVHPTDSDRLSSRLTRSRDKLLDTVGLAREDARDQLGLDK